MKLFYCVFLITCGSTLVHWQRLWFCPISPNPISPNPNLRNVIKVVDVLSASWRNPNPNPNGPNPRIKRNGIRRIGIRQNGKTPRLLWTVRVMCVYVRLLDCKKNCLSGSLVHCQQQQQQQHHHRLHQPVSVNNTLNGTHVTLVVFWLVTGHFWPGS